MTALPMQQGAAIGGLLSGYPQMPMPPNSPSVFAQPATQGSNAAADFAALQASSGSERFNTLWDQMMEKYGSVDKLNQMMIGQAQGGQSGQLPSGSPSPQDAAMLQQVSQRQPSTMELMLQSAQQGQQLGGLLNDAWNGPQTPASGAPSGQPPLNPLQGQPNPGPPRPSPQDMAMLQQWRPGGQGMNMPQMGAANRQQMGPQQGPPRPVNTAGMAAMAQGQQVPGGGPQGGYAPQHINRFLNKQEPHSGARDPYPVPLPNWDQAVQETVDGWQNRGGLSGLFGLS